MCLKRHTKKLAELNSSNWEEFETI